MSHSNYSMDHYAFSSDPYAVGIFFFFFTFTQSGCILGGSLIYKSVILLDDTVINSI